MTNIVVVFPKLEDAKKIKNILVRNGYEVAAVCSSAAAALHSADGLVNGVLISAYKLPDMMYSEMKEYLPAGFELLLLVSQRQLEECTDLSKIACLSMPFAIRDFLNLLEQTMQSVVRKKRQKQKQIIVRNAEEKQQIDKAKEWLMTNRDMTEAQAHKYLQKSSMDSGTNLVEAAKMILTMEEYRKK